MSFRTGEFAIGLIVGIGATCALLLGGNALLDLGLMKAEDGPADWISAVAGFGAMITSLVGVFFLRANLKATNEGVLAALDANHIQSEGSRAWLTVELAPGALEKNGSVVRLKNVGTKPALDVTVQSKLISPADISYEKLREVAQSMSEYEVDKPFHSVLMLPSGQENDFHFLVSEPKPDPAGEFYNLIVVASYRSLANADRKITAQVFSPYSGLLKLLDKGDYARTNQGVVT